jgi:hypothetical protein
VDLLALVCEDFPELPWLNAKGYYVIEEFVVNRVEIALRMSWATAGGGAGGGRKVARIGKGVKEKAGLAANTFWREKGYVDWWMKLEPQVRASITAAFFGKGAMALVTFFLVLHFEGIYSSMNLSYYDVCVFIDV